VTNAEKRELYELLLSINDNEYAMGKVMEIMGRNTTFPDAGFLEIDIAILPVSTIRKLQRFMKELNQTANSPSVVDTQNLIRPTNRERKNKYRTSNLQSEVDIQNHTNLTARERKNHKHGVPKQRRNSDTQLNTSSKSLIDLKNEDEKKPKIYPPESRDTVVTKRVCVVCMDAPTEAVIAPCGHLAMCLEDAKKLKECPICRVSYTPSQVIKVFQSGIEF